MAGSDNEAIERLRRIETRLVRYFEHVGFDSGARKPRWHANGEIDLPSMDMAVKDIIAVIPPDWRAQVLLVHKDRVVATIAVPAR